ncbi:dihydrofolate synthase, partial [Curtobacterium flaccumfaciens]|nr:dihydrofolate synthase [Curtobacterium flaccumfaciens]
VERTDDQAEDRVVVEPSLASALQEARSLADEADAEDALVLVAGSIVMVGAVMDLVHREGEAK